MASYSAVDRLVLAALALAREVERDNIPLDTIDELEEALKPWLPIELDLLELALPLQ